MNVDSLSGTLPRIAVPQRDTVFVKRAWRFRYLANGHPLDGWLRFLGLLAQVQHAVLREFRSEPVLDADTVELARTHGMPPVSAQQWRPRERWQDAARAIAAGLYDEAPGAARASLARLRELGSREFAVLAERALCAELPGPDADLLPYVAAALQVLWTHAAASLGSSGIPALGISGVCPCCGSLPVASVIRPAADIPNLRYLHCSLCNTQWNFVRAACASCGTDAAVAYRQLETAGGPASAAVRAETCDHCMGYLKAVHQDVEPTADPVADDLATLALDVLVDSAGYRRSGPNLLFVPGH